MGKKEQPQKNSRKRRFLIFLLGIIVGGIGYYIYQVTQEAQKTTQTTSTGEKTNLIQVQYSFSGYDALLGREGDILKQFSFDPEKILSGAKVTYIDDSTKPQNQSFTMTLSVLNGSGETTQSTKGQLGTVFGISFPTDKIVFHQPDTITIIGKLPNKIGYPEDILAVTVTDTQAHQEKTIPFNQDTREFTYVGIQAENIGYLFRAYTKDRVFHAYIDLTVPQTNNTNTGNILTSSGQVSSIALYESPAISKQDACKKENGMYPTNIETQRPNMKTETWNFVKNNNTLLYAVGASKEGMECGMEEYSFFTYECSTGKAKEIYNEAVQPQQGKNACAIASIFADDSYVLYDSYPYEGYPATTLLNLNIKEKKTIDIFQKENGVYTYKNIDKLLEKTEQLESEHNKGKLIKDSSDRPWKQRSIASCSSITSCTIYYSVYLDGQVKIDYTGASIDLINKSISVQ